MCNHELKRLFYTSDDYGIQSCRVELEKEDDKYTLCYCEKCGQVFVMEIAKTHTEPDRKAIEDEVWEFVRIITDMTEKQRIECFGGASCDLDEYWTYQDAKAKYEEWKKSKDDIHVGDEVTDNELDEIGVVTYANDSYCCVLWSDGVVSEEVRKSEFRSTGRHFNITHELLKKMKEHREKDGN